MYDTIEVEKAVEKFQRGWLIVGRVVELDRRADIDSRRSDLD